MASSNEARVAHVKVSEIRDFADEHCGPNSLEGAGESAKRRRVAYDSKKPSHQKFGTSMSTDSKHTPTSESKGNILLYMYILIWFTSIQKIQRGLCSTFLFRCS